MTIFHGARDRDDPGIATLRTDRLALAMLDVQLRRRRTGPARAMKLVQIAFWLAFGFAVAGTVLVQL